MKCKWTGPVICAAMAALIFAVCTETASAQVTTQPVTDQTQSLIGLSQIFTYFFIMLGPIKIIGPFAKMTAGADDGERKSIAIQGFVVATVIGIVAAFAGARLLDKWGISSAAMLIAAGIVMLIVSLRGVLSQYEPAAPTAPPDAAHDAPRPLSTILMTPLVFPTIITPYGMAVLMLLMAAAPDTSRNVGILAVFVAVMVLNLLAMLFARQILKLVGPGVLGALGAVLGILIVALSVQVLVSAAAMLGLIHSPVGLASL